MDPMLNVTVRAKTSLVHTSKFATLVLYNLLSKAYRLQIYRISRINITLSLLKISALCSILIRFYGPLTWQNRRCELGWFSLRQSQLS